MEGDCAPLEALSRLARRHGAEIILDEAHATGVYGPQGRGIAAEVGCEDEIFATVHTCGKALASAGAFVCGSAALTDYLVNHARTFIFSTAMPPYMAGQIQAALSLAREADARTHAPPAHCIRVAKSADRARLPDRDGRDAYCPRDPGNKRSCAARGRRAATQRFRRESDPAAYRTCRNCANSFLAHESDQPRRHPSSYCGDGRRMPAVATIQSARPAKCLSVSS